MGFFGAGGGGPIGGDGFVDVGEAEDFEAVFVAEAGDGEELLDEVADVLGGAGAELHADGPRHGLGRVFAGCFSSIGASVASNVNWI